MAQEDARGPGQGQKPLNRAIQRPRVAAGKVAARRAVVRHEQGVAGEDSVADHIGQAGRGVARDVQGGRLQPADGEAVSVVEQLVELAAVAAELGPFIEDFAEGVLDLDDVAADGQATAQALLQIGRGGQVVGVGVSLQQPMDLQVLGLDKGDQGVGRSGRGSA
ncbi:hypothetical protein D3C80_1662170 [compost metagenome]